MSYLYVTEQGAVIGLNANRIVVNYKDGMTKSIPIETMEAISIFGGIQITTQCLQECLKRGINVVFYSKNGGYFGRMISTTHVNVARQRKQADIYRSEKFKLEFSQRIIDAKIRNQIVILRRYARNSPKEKEIFKGRAYGMKNNAGQSTEETITEMQHVIKKLPRTDSIEQLMGYEGTAARLYFRALGELVEPAFAFHGRTRQPPKDAFNSMISLGYSIILNEIYGKLEARGLNPYFGIMHKDREKHPTLASDLMEEWRAVLVDATMMSLVNGHEVSIDGFYREEDREGVFLDKDTFKIVVGKLEKKFRTDNKYLSYVDYSVSFRRAMDLQIMQLIKAMEAEDASLYTPIIIR